MTESAGLTPAEDRASSATATDLPPDGNWNSAPPLKSMPREKPRISMLATQTISRSAEKAYQIRRRPTKSTWDWLR